MKCTKLIFKGLSYPAKIKEEQIMRTKLGNLKAAFNRTVVMVLTLCMVAGVMAAVITQTAPKAEAAELTANSAASLQTALNNAANGDTIKVTANIDMARTALSVSGSKSITLNLQSYTVSWSGDRNNRLPTPVFTVGSGVTLTIRGSSSGTLSAYQDHTGMINCNASVEFIRTSGTVILESGNISAETYVSGNDTGAFDAGADGYSDPLGVAVKSGGRFVQNGGAVNVKSYLHLSPRGSINTGTDPVVYIRLKGIVIDSGGTGEMNAGTLDINSDAGVKNNGREDKRIEHYSYAIVNEGSFTFNGGTITHWAQSRSTKKPRVTHYQYIFAGSKSPVITGGNATSTISRDGSYGSSTWVHQAIQTNSYIDAYGNTVSNVSGANGGSPTSHGGQTFISGGTPYSGSTVLRIEYDYLGTITSSPNANIGTVTVSSNVGWKSAVTNPSTGSQIYNVANGANITINPIVTPGYTYYYYIDARNYMARSNANAASVSTSAIPANNVFTVNATNNYIIRVVYRKSTASTPTITINDLSPVYTGSARGYNTLFNINVFAGTDDITSYYNVDGSTPGKIGVTYEFSIQGADVWSSSYPTNAGTYDVRVTLADDTAVRNGGRNVNAATATGTVTIQKATPNPGNPTVTLTYGQSLAQATVQLAPGLTGTWAFDSPDVTPAVANSDTTLYGATFIPTDTNYNTVYRTFTITVNKATVTVTAKPVTQEYGTNPRTYEIVYSGFVLGENENTAGVFTGSTRPTASSSYVQYANVGTYPINVSVAGVSGPNYNFVVGPASNVTVTPAPLTVTATAVDRVYDGTANVTVNFGTLLGILNNDQVYLSTSTVTGTVADMNVGSGKEVTFTIPALAGAKAGNYAVSVSNLPVRVNISKATPTPPAVSFSPMSYDPTRVLSSLSLPAGVTWDSPSTVPTVSVTSYPATFTPADTVNYNIVNFNIPITITKAPVVIKADNKSTTYGQAEPAFTYTFSGFIGPDIANPPPRTGNITASTDYDRDDPAKRGVGTYQIILSGNPMSDNYYYTFESGILTVNKATVNVTAENKSVVYGSAAPQYTFTYNAANFFYGDTPASSVNTSGVTFNCAYAVGSPVGTYAINFSGLTSANYTFNYIPGTLTVTKATLRVKGDDVSIHYGSPVPAFTVSYSGWVAYDNDSNNDLIGSPAFSCDYTVGSPVTPGGYLISVAQGSLSSNNYNFEFERGILYVVKADPVITTWPTATVTYLDNLSAPAWSSWQASVPGTFVFNNVTTVPTFEVGRTYPATFRPEDSVNYNDVVGEVLVIVNRRSISGSVSIEGIAMATSTLSADVTGIVPSEAHEFLSYSWVINNVEISTSSDTGVLTEDYINYVAVLTVTANGPFEGVITVTSPVITQLKTIPTVGNLIFTPPSNIDYDAQPHPLEVLPRNDVGPFTVLYNGSTIAPKNAGTYTITVDFAGNDDFAAAVGVYLGSFEIRKVDLYATYTVNTKTYDGNANATYSNLLVHPLGDDQVLLTTTGVTATFNNKNAGTNKPVTLTGLLITGPDAGNYNLKIQNTTGTILQREVTVPAVTVSRPYNGTTSVTLSFQNGLSNVVAGDTVNYAQNTATAYVETPDAGVNKPLVSEDQWTLPALIGADAANYKLRVIVNNPTVTITKADPSYVLPQLADLVYDPATTLADIPLTGGWSWVDPEIIPTPDVAAYMALFVPADTHNYNSINVAVPLMVNKATVYVKPNDVIGLVYGSPVPSFTLSYTGFKGNDNALDSITGGNVNFNTPYAQYADVGEYLITLSGGYTSNNYQFVLQTGTLTVVKKNVSAVATAVSRPYAPANTTVTVNFSAINGVVNNDDVSLSFTSTTGTIPSPNVGLRAVTFTPPILTGARANNYNLSIDTGIVVEIVKATPTGVVFPSQATIEYGLPLASAQFRNDYQIPVATPGQFVFEDISIVPTELGSGRSYMVVFQPDEYANYNSISQLVPLVVNIRQLTPQISIVGTFEETKTIYASVRGIPDEAKPYVKYTWFRGDPEGPEGTYTIIGTDATYVISSQDVGSKIYLKVNIGDNEVQPFFAPEQLAVTDTIKEITLTFWEKIAKWFESIIIAIQKLFDVTGRSFGG